MVLERGVDQPVVGKLGVPDGRPVLVHHLLQFAAGMTLAVVGSVLQATEQQQLVQV